MMREHRQNLAAVDLHDVMAVVAHEVSAARRSGWGQGVNQDEKGSLAS
jgi:hypothetical protein